ncbi:Smr/MutS family protein [Methylovirgula sp. 4M-Z18]|uniref:Smr/MutS family protein n=1 Tax=Methylovirgula sp. 4M-Z18 TaxID=2293567 RepID=UPI000E2FC138|nr:Smr/MutS family protein [Methylovirgula sp. 4M-Z18]RFB78054.1 DNA mismatch repair protein MutS [Methylovirgula sp. 4M-Z18]
MKEPRTLLKSGDRRLSDEDIELWLHVTRHVKARPGVHRPPAPARPAPAKPPAASSARSKTDPVAPPPAKPALPPLVPLERRMRQKVSRGRIEVDGVIDLHGLRQSAAHDALIGFLLRAQADGAKLVVVVTGKGKSVRDELGYGREGGILRRFVPQWLASPELRSVVVGYEEASIAHGGAGALYVRIRRLGRHP